MLPHKTASQPPRLKFKSLFLRHPRQDYREICAHFPWEGDREQNNANDLSWEEPFQKLAQMAKGEQWNFQRNQFTTKYSNQKFPILTSYLNYTFLRLQDLDRLAYSEDGVSMCFNTGLQTPEEKDIYAVFFRHQAPDKCHRPNWVFDRFAESYNNVLRQFPRLPEIATYIKDPADLVFDPNLEIDVNYDHMLNTPDNRERLPQSLKSNNRTALLALKGSIESLRDKVLRNYKVAIPHWYGNRIQLLLPLYLTNEAIADNALIVDKDMRSRMYLARTVLTMDMAYIDARIITRPDREWLNP
jgi:hypothetical protein